MERSEPPQVIGWVDASAGAGADMVLGALVDAGVPVDEVQALVETLGPGEVKVRAEPACRGGVGATRVVVDAAAGPVSRTLADVRALLEPARLPAAVLAPAMATYELLARAEGAVRRMDPGEVSLHEAATRRAIVEVLGVYGGLRWLQANRGLAGLRIGPVEVGCADASASSVVPAPTVLEIARQAGLSVTGSLPRSTCTASGAAVLATMATQLARQSTPPVTDVAAGVLPALRVTAVGVGAGELDTPGTPNVLRLVLGAPSVDLAVVDPVLRSEHVHNCTFGGRAGDADPLARPARFGAETVALLECNVDDMDPRLWPGVLSALIASGAGDAWLTPILMTAGRPGHTLHVLCPLSSVDALRALVFRHTTTLGLRQSIVDSYALERTEATVVIGGRPVRVSLGTLDGRVVNSSAEYPDVVDAATALRLPVKVVLARTTSAALRVRLDPDEPQT